MLGFNIGKWLASLAKPVGDFNTAGGDEPDARAPEWNGGRYLGAEWKPIHPGRQGGAIKPWAVVVHTTDMHPSTFGSLVKAWQRDAGRGAGAHFILGRTPAEGLVQMVECDRNGNHAGGNPAHGWFLVNGQKVHPNRVTIGIEVHAAGSVKQDVSGAWRTWDDGRPFGAPLDPADVVPDPKRKGRGWHTANAYQLAELDRLLTALAACPVMVAEPRGFSIVPNGEQPAYAPQVGWHGPNARVMPVVGHVTLDPNRKSDPGPVISDWLRANAG